MLRRLLAILLLTGIAACAFQAKTGDSPPVSNHQEWVVQALKKMLTIRPGMTREQLLIVFTPEGGLSGRTRRTYVSRDCPYFKVTVTFRAVGAPNKQPEGNVGPGENQQDVILTISQPYLAYGIYD